MKKIIALILAFMLCASLTACTSLSKIVENAVENAVESGISGLDTVEETSDKDFSSLDEYVDFFFADANKEEFEGLTYTVYADGNTLVYDYTYTEQLSSEEAAATKEILDDTFESDLGEVSRNILDGINELVNVKNPQIQYIYRNNDGTVITEHTFR